MRRRTRLVLLAASLGLIVPTAIDASAASAIDQDLVVSTAAGPAGTQVTVSSASCSAGSGEDVESILSVRLVAGTAPDEVLAGAASVFSGDEDEATIVIPDWIDPDAPAVIEAACVQFDFAEGSETSIAFDPVAFDVEASIDPPVQARTYSRTSMQAGQAFAVEASGCFLPGAAFGGVDVTEGSDLTFRTGTNFVASGGGQVEDDAFWAPTALSNGFFGVSFSQSGDEPPVINEIDEVATDIPAGTYTTISYCATNEGTYLMFEPELIEVTGNAPFGEIDLTVPAESRTATLAGAACSQGDVSLEMGAIDLVEALGDATDDGAADADVLRVQASDVERSARRSTAGNGDRRITRTNGAWAAAQVPALATRALSDDGYVEATVTPDADGAWASSDDVGFDNGIVEGFAWCGDPLQEGFIYDPQAAAVVVSPAEETTTTTTTAPAPVPANAVAGTPTYAG